MKKLVLVGALVLTAAPVFCQFETGLLQPGRARLEAVFVADFRSNLEGALEPPRPSSVLQDSFTSRTSVAIPRTPNALLVSRLSEETGSNRADRSADNWILLGYFGVSVAAVLVSGSVFLQGVTEGDRNKKTFGAFGMTVGSIVGSISLLTLEVNLVSDLVDRIVENPDRQSR